MYVTQSILNLHLKMLNSAPKWHKLMPEIPNVRFSCGNSNIRDLLQILAAQKWPRKLRLSKSTIYTAYWKALQDHFLMVPADTFQFNCFHAEYPAVSVIVKLSPDTAVEMSPIPMWATASTGGSKPCLFCHRSTQYIVHCVGDAILASVVRGTNTSIALLCLLR
jgi:hypothetical protein